MEGLKRLLIISDPNGLNHAVRLTLFGDGAGFKELRPDKLAVVQIVMDEHRHDYEWCFIGTKAEIEIVMFDFMYACYYSGEEPGFRGNDPWNDTLEMGDPAEVSFEGNGLGKHYYQLFKFCQVDRIAEYIGVDSAKIKERVRLNFDKISVDDKPRIVAQLHEKFEDVVAWKLLGLTEDQVS